MYQRFPDQEACIDHLEEIRFGYRPFCPLCGCVYVARKTDGNRIGRWTCYGCRSSYNVLSGTLFAGTRIPLQKWFYAIDLMLAAAKGISSYQMARHLAMDQKTAWSMMQRIRMSMFLARNRLILKGLVEADETYVGGDARPGSNQGWGTTKLPVLGIVERGGRVVASPLNEVTAESIREFFENTVMEGSELHTDGLIAYQNLKNIVCHRVVKRHQKRFRNNIHTNTIEGFWSIIKRAWKGTFHNYGKERAHLYAAETCYRFNARKNPDGFNDFIIGELFGDKDPI